MEGLAAEQQGIKQRDKAGNNKGECGKEIVWKREREEMRHWWRQTGGRAVGRRWGSMPIWCLHLSVNVMSSVWQQMTRTGRGQVRSLTQGVSISASAPSFTSLGLTCCFHLCHPATCSCTLNRTFYTLCIKLCDFENYVKKDICDHKHKMHFLMMSWQR